MKTLTTLLAAVAVSSAAQAFVPADPSTLLSAKSSARGFSTAAAPEQNIDGLLLNPASLAFQNQYAISFGLSGMGGALGVSIVDTKSGPMGGGLYYIRRDLTKADPVTLLLGDYRRLEERAGLALFTKFSDRFAMGLTGKYFSQKSDVVGIREGRAFNGDLSVAVSASPEFNVAFTGQNLLSDETGAQPRAFIFGAEYKMASRFAVSAQLMSVSGSELATGFELPNADASAWSVGGMYQISNFQLRMGYLRNEVWQRHVITGGLGYGDKKFSVDYAFQHEQNSAQQFHGISVTGYL